MSTEKSSTKGLPVVDLGQLGIGASQEPREEEWQRVARELKDAFSTVGFVYLDNHGIPSTVVERVFESAATFFSLDDDTKVKYSKEGFSKVQHGYVEVNREQLDDKVSKHLELRESYYLKDMEKGSFPDEELPELRSQVKALHDACLRLLPNLFTVLSLALDQNRDFFASSHQQLFSRGANSSCMRLNYYPPVPSSTPENSVRCGTHTDYGSITLLFQDSMGGLQVRDASGTWIEATPIPGTILVNAGDLLQMWTAGRFIATEHRVLIPKQEVQLRSPRQSVVFFLNPDDDEVIKPLDAPGDYPAITAKQHLLDRYAKTYRY